MYYQRDLPHWQPEGAALFLTWRLAGSLPREYFLREKTLTAGQEFVVMDRLLDRAEIGPMWLQSERVAQCVVDALRYGESGLDLYHLRAWVLMSNHVHLLIEPRAALPRIVRAVRSFSGREANRILGRSGSFWQHEGYDHWVRDRAERDRIRRYIEANPVNAGLVLTPEEWK